AQVNLSWQDNSTNEQGFRVLRSTDAGQRWSQIAQVGANTSSCADTHASAGTTYWYEVYAYNAGGGSADSNVAQATTPLLPTRTRLPGPDVPEYGTLVLIAGSVYGPDNAEAIQEAAGKPGGRENALLILLDEVYAATLKIAN